MRYILDHEIKYHSQRYNKWVTVPVGYESDGATGASDIYSHAWWIHDMLCDRGTWDGANGEEVTRLEAATVLSDILKSEGRWFRARTWFLATYLFGCKKVR